MKLLWVRRLAIVFSVLGPATAAHAAFIEFRPPAVGDDIVVATVNSQPNRLVNVTLILNAPGPVELEFELSDDPGTHNYRFAMIMNNFGFEAWEELSFTLGTGLGDAFVEGTDAAKLTPPYAENSFFQSIAGSATAVTLSDPILLFGFNTTAVTTLLIDVMQPQTPVDSFVLRATPAVPEPASILALAGSALLGSRSFRKKP